MGPSSSSCLLCDLPPPLWRQLLGPRRSALLAAKSSQGYGMRVLGGFTGSLFYDGGGQHVDVLWLALLA